MNGRTGVYAVIVSMSVVVGGLLAAPPAQAACGAVQCFVVIGSQQQVPQKGLLTVNGIYSYTPMTLPLGSNGLIPEVDQSRRRLIPNHHRELTTITQAYTLDMNYGVTDRFGVQVTVPYMARKHDHKHFHGGQDTELIGFSDKGIGDIRVTAKYNALMTLRSMIVAGFGVELPTGDTDARDNAGGVMESATQLGRGNVGLVGSGYQTYELIPHRLNQFAFASYRHTFKNNDGYQFGDEYLLNVGLNLVTVPWLVLTNQFNYRYMTHDIVSASLSGGPIMDWRVPNTGHTFMAYTPGFQISLSGLTDAAWARMASLYFYSQIPVARDANNNLAQGTSYVFGITKSFQLTES
jgi:hypothetical protein